MERNASLRPTIVCLAGLCVPQAHATSSVPRIFSVFRNVDQPYGTPINPVDRTFKFVNNGGTNLHRITLRYTTDPDTEDHKFRAGYWNRDDTSTSYHTVIQPSGFTHQTAVNGNFWRQHRSPIRRRGEHSARPSDEGYDRGLPRLPALPQPVDM